MQIVNLPIECRGRNAKHQEVLGDPVSAKVNISVLREKDIFLRVECPYNTGSHCQRCKASHPNVDKVGDGAICPYTMDIPYVLDTL
jgi:hypothetical protein